MEEDLNEELVESTIIGPNLVPVPANVLFRDGAPLTGQSDHLANLQIGIEDTDQLSQATILVSYASERVTNRGPIQGLLSQPDIIERPGWRVDFVLRQEVRLFRTRAEFKFEARNLFGQDYEEFQEFGDNRIDINSYRLGQSFSASFTTSLKVRPVDRTRSSSSRKMSSSRVRVVRTKAS